MPILTYNNNILGQNTYLYYDAASGEGVIIDAGCGAADIKEMLSVIGENNIAVKAILLTHGHYDHISAVDDLRKSLSAYDRFSATEDMEKFIKADDHISAADDLRKSAATNSHISATNGLPPPATAYKYAVDAENARKSYAATVYCHADEKQILENPRLNFSAFMGKPYGVTPDQIIQDGDIIRFGSNALKIIHTPGHTRGGICFYDEENGVAFTGDTLFRESVGRTDLPSGSHSRLVKSIRDKLFILPDETAAYPGHGETTNIGYEKRYNPFIK